MVGTKFFIFGGQVAGEFLNDLWAFDLQLRKLNISTFPSYIHYLSKVKAKPFWELYEPANSERPAQRTGHVCITFEDQIIM